MLLAASIGLILAVGGAFLIEYLDDTIKSREDVKRVLNLPTLGTTSHIPNLRQPSDHLMVVDAAHSAKTEEYRALRTSIQFSQPASDEVTLLVTSALASEGKSTVASNVGAVMAMAGMEVILVDADLHRPALHRFFGVPNEVGLSNLMVDRALDLESTLLDTPVEGLKLIPSGLLPPNPAELLGSEVMKWRLDQMKALADVIIIDSPPALVMADTAIVGALCTGALLVVNAGRTRSDMARQLRETVEQVGVNILGVVLNNVTTHTGDYYYHRYYTQEEADGARVQLGNAARAIIGRVAVNGHNGNTERSATGGK